MSVTFTELDSRRLAAESPPNPPPTITTFQGLFALAMDEPSAGAIPNAPCSLRHGFACLSFIVLCFLGRGYRPHSRDPQGTPMARKTMRKTAPKMVPRRQ